MNTRVMLFRHSWNRVIWIHVIALTLATTLVAATFGNHFNAGLEHARTGNHRQAIKIWRNLLQAGDGRLSAKQQVRIYYHIADSCLSLGKHEIARKFLDKARALAPDNQSIEALYARIAGNEGAVATGSEPGSLEDAEESLENGFLNERIQAGMGNDSFQQARNLFQKLLNAGNTKPRVRVGLATAILYTDISDTGATEARKHLEAALQENASDPAALHMLGLALARQGDTPGEKTHLARAKAAGNSTPQFTRDYIRCQGKQATISSSTRSQLISMAKSLAGSNVELTLGLTDEFRDSGLKNTIDKMISSARSKASRASSSSSRSSSSRSSSSSSGGSSRNNTFEGQSTSGEGKKGNGDPAESKPKRELTQKEKNIEQYDKTSKIQYLQHLDRLRRGKPTSWNRPIPDLKEKKEKK